MDVSKNSPLTDFDQSRWTSIDRPYALLSECHMFSHAISLFQMVLVFLSSGSVDQHVAPAAERADLGSRPRILNLAQSHVLKSFNMLKRLLHPFAIEIN